MKLFKKGFSAGVLKLAATVILFLGFSQPANASHVVGGDLSWQYLSPTNYVVTLRLYRDCSGVILTNTAVVSAQGNCAAPLQNFTLNQVGGPVEITSCQVGLSTCQGGTLPGVQMYTYSGVISLQGGCSDYTVFYELCCRSAGITNLAVAASTAFRIEGHINPAIANSSPTFAPIFNPFACVNQNHIFATGGYDPDSDSLVYSLVDALDMNGAPAIYAAGFSASNPVASAPGTLLFNPVNGTVQFTANQLQFSTINVKVDEYRNGVLIGSTMREYAIWVINCTSNILCGNNVLSGRVFHDVNASCDYSPATDVPMGAVLLELMPGPLYQMSQPDGRYQFNLTSGNYTVREVLDPGSYFEDTCNGPGFVHNVSFPSMNDSSMDNDFPNAATILCPRMDVSIATGLLRPCMQSNISVAYCNNGSIMANNAYVTVDIPSPLVFVSSTITPSSVSGTLYTFPLGNVPWQYCSAFGITVSVPCDTAMVGLTPCVEAHIYPDSLCEPVDTVWDRSSLSVTGSCQNDSLACFTVTNTGSSVNGNMTGPSQYRIFVNNVLVFTGYLQLCGGCDTTICWPAQGNTIRFEVDQRPGHPGNSQPNDEIENCGNPNQIVGQIGQLPLDDADEFVDIFCREIVLSYDPNRKTSSPVGTQAQHYITANDHLEYLIEFQNTGNAPAIDIVLRDTLSTYLDLSTVVAGAMSHNGSFNIVGPGVLQWTFAGINLPDSASNEPASHGWVTFRAKQVPGNAIGTVIENRVGIIFDINAPVLTNMVFNTIGEPVVTGTEDRNPVTDAYQVKVYPNPAQNEVNFLVMGMNENENLTIEVYDLAGARVASVQGRAGQVQHMDCSNFARGMFVYRVLKGNAVAAAGKMVVN